MTLIKKSNLSLIVLLLSLSVTPLAYCLPQDEQVVSGTATFDRPTSDTLNINTPSDKLIVNYSGFDIAKNETVNFNQPSTSAIALNRVTEGTNPTQILGSLNANGRIFIINQNGVLFGQGSRVDAAALVASTLDIEDTDFLAGKYNFFKSGVNAYIINKGNITIRNGGYVYLLSQAVDNQGSIQANLGTIVLSSGEKMTLALDDMNDISVAIAEGVKEAVFGPDGKKIVNAVKNSGTISANGGKVILTAKVLNNVFDYAVNNTGVIEAKNVIEHDGVIELTAEGAPIINTGTIKAGRVTITAPGTDVINKGTIASNGSDINPNGGIIAISANTILQAGIVTANALENGTAGEVRIVSTTSTTMDDNSSTEARATGIIGNGGRITIDSLKGKTLVNKGAVIDVSSGTTNGNAGYIEVGAFDQIGFYGVLNGRAPPWATAATVKFVYHSTNAPPVIIITDKADYPPSGTPIISGAGFRPNQEVTLNIFAPDGTQATLTTTADANGSFTLIYTPATLQWGAYFATGSDGVRSAVTMFTDTSPKNTKITIANVTGIYGGTVDLTAILKEGKNPVTGVTISFTFDGNLVGTAITDGQGKALLNVSLGVINAGTHNSYIGASFAGNTNYKADSGTAKLTVDPKALTVTANSASKTYGQAYTFDTTTPSADFSVSGLVNSDSVDSITLTSAGAAATAAVGTGSYAITPSAASGTGLDNYTIGYTNGTLTVNKAVLTVTAANKSKAYGAALPTLTYTYTGLVNGDIATDTLPTITTTATAASHVTGSPYPITASGAADADYTISYTAGALTVTPVVLTVTADNKSKVYGANVPALTVSYSGFVLGDDSGDLNTKPTASTSATKSSSVGNYDITASGGADNNYSFSYVKGTLNITKAPLTVTANSQTKTYGDSSLGTSAFTSSGLQNEEAIGSVTLDTNATLSTSSNYNVGTWTIAPSAATGGTFTASNYDITYTNAPAGLTVNPKTITVTGITANDKVYDRLTSATLNTDSSALSENVIGDDVTLNTSTALGAFADKNIGTGKTVTVSGLTISGADIGNYTLTQPTTTANITPKELTVTGITANNKPYDGLTSATLITTSATLSGNIVGDAVTLDTASAAGAFSDINIGNGKIVNVSGLTINGADADNYALTQPTTTANITDPTLASELSNASNPRILIIDSQTLGLYQFNSGGQSAYFYHPLTELDMSAFDEFIIEDGAYQFMDDGSIGIVGHDGLLRLYQLIP